MQSPQICINIEFVEKTFVGQPRPALSNISLEVEEGATLAIVGPNGAGKSTLLKCIAGLIPVDSGAIKVDARDRNECAHGANTTAGINYPRELRKQMGLVFQDSALWTHLPVFENVVRPLVDIKGETRDRAEELARTWLIGRFQLSEEQLDKYPAQLSPGEARRVALARTFSMGPSILLIDEIEASLDPEAAELLLDLLYEHFTKLPTKTVIQVTHRLDLLERIASRVIFLDTGTVTTAEPPEQFLANNTDAKLRRMRNAVGPARSGASMGMICLEQVFGILETGRSGEDGRDGGFQTVAEKVSNLVVAIDDDPPGPGNLPDRPKVDPRHLLLLVAKQDSQFWIRGLAAHEVTLDGKDAAKLGELVFERTGVYDLVHDYAQKTRKAGVFLKVENNRSLIAMMFTKARKKISYTYAPSFNPIHGVYHTPVPAEDSALREAYYEFSKNTKSVYLFPLEHRDEVIGVLSIDSYSERKWPPFVVREFKMIANICAAAIARS